MNYEYERAAQYLIDEVKDSSFDIPTKAETVEEQLNEFKNRFSPEKLKNLKDEELLSSIFFTSGNNENALCYWLEMNPDCKEYFGSISGGSAFKYGLFQRKDTGIWTKGGSKKPVTLSEDEALEYGKSIRDALVKGVEIISNASLNSLEDYEELHDTLIMELGEQICNWSWVHKYFSIICYDRLSSFHSKDWQLHVLRALRIRPSDKSYARSGQIAMVQNRCKWYYRQFFDVFYELFGEPIQFIRLGCNDEKKVFANEWSKDNVVGIGWSKIGSLSSYMKNGIFDRESLKDKLKEFYFPNDNRTASSKAGELGWFYTSNSDNTVFVIMHGKKLIALADKLGDYYFDASSSMPHKRPASWFFAFKEGETLDNYGKAQSSCLPIVKSEDNMLYLYEKYFYDEEVEPSSRPIELSSNTVAKVDIVSENKIRFCTGYQSDLERNRILFGAPGTGKSYLLNREAKELIADEDDYERVTFHPDYSYANFVGTYKPVPYADNDGNTAITYEYVPGPFMRVYVNALKNSKTENIKPYLLIIEEINRANVAAVFGDIFQLLDRNDDHFSEYPIEATEDMKRYLAKELGGKPDEYSKICIPDNMFIWATMNSADQGVYPVDTAFKRRWDFTYLGIDDSDEDIRDKYVVLGADKSQKVYWNNLRQAINHFLTRERINEDKQLGPYFIARKIVVPSDGKEIERDNFIRVFKNKVIMYLFEDAAKQKRLKLFPNSLRYSEICKEFDLKGIEIFNQDIQNETHAEEIQQVNEEAE